MGIINNIKNFSQGVHFHNFRHLVTNEIFLNSLRYTFYRINKRTPKEKLDSILSLDFSEENLSAEDFANLEDYRGLSLLQLAASNLNAEAVKILLENGADANHVSLKSPTKAFSPLIYALGTKGKIVYPTRDSFSDWADYDEHLEEEMKRVLKDPKSFENFKSTVDVLIQHNGVALSPFSLVFTDKQANKRTGWELVEFAIACLDNDENFKFYKNDESGNRVPVQKSEIMEYLLTIDYFKDAISPELISYAKQYDYTAFRVLLDAVPDKKTMLNDVHEYEAAEIAYYLNKELLSADDVRNVLEDIRKKGLDPDNLPVCPEKFAYEAVMRKYNCNKENYESLTRSHQILTEYDSPETFNFKYVPYYDLRYIEGEVVSLRFPNIVTATAYLREAENNEAFAMENYTQDVVEAFPRILKHGNINHFIGVMEGQFSLLHQLEDEFKEEK